MHIHTQINKSTQTNINTCVSIQTLLAWIQQHLQELLEILTTQTHMHTHTHAHTHVYNYTHNHTLLCWMQQRLEELSSTRSNSSARHSSSSRAPVLPPLLPDLERGAVLRPEQRGQRPPRLQHSFARPAVRHVALPVTSAPPTSSSQHLPHTAPSVAQGFHTTSTSSSGALVAGPPVQGPRSLGLQQAALEVGERLLVAIQRLGPEVQQGAPAQLQRQGPRVLEPRRRDGRQGGEGG